MFRISELKNKKSCFPFDDNKVYIKYAWEHQSDGIFVNIKLNKKKIILP